MAAAAPTRPPRAACSAADIVKTLAVTLLLPGVAAAPVAAGTLAGVTLPDKAGVRSQTLVLNGMGLRGLGQ